VTAAEVSVAVDDLACESQTESRCFVDAIDFFDLAAAAPALLRCRYVIGVLPCTAWLILSVYTGLRL